MSDHGEYVGPHKALQGRRALLDPDGETRNQPLESRLVWALFWGPDTPHPETGLDVTSTWIKYPAAHFKLLVPVRV